MVYIERTAKQIARISPSRQEQLWKSVVKVSCEEETSGTAIVIDMTDDKIYVLTNLHTWATEVPGIFEPHFSEEFNEQLRQYRKDLAMRLYKPPRSGKRPRNEDPPEVVVEQLLERKLGVAAKFKLCPDACWSASSSWDYAIFELERPKECQLEAAYFCFDIFTTMPVHVLGFPGALPHGQFDFRTQLLWRNNCLGKHFPFRRCLPRTLGWCRCLHRTWHTRGYIGGALDASHKNEQWQAAFKPDGILASFKTPPSSQDSNLSADYDLHKTIFYYGFRSSRAARPCHLQPIGACLSFRGALEREIWACEAWKCTLFELQRPGSDFKAI